MKLTLNTAVKTALALVPVSLFASTHALAANVVPWTTYTGHGGDILFALTDETSDSSYVLDLQQGVYQFVNGTFTQSTFTVTPGTGTGQDPALNTFLNNAISGGDAIDFSVVGATWNPAHQLATNTMITTTGGIDPSTFGAPLSNQDLNHYEAESAIVTNLNTLPASTSHSWAANAGATGNFGVGNNFTTWEGFSQSNFGTNLLLGTPVAAGTGSNFSVTQGLYEFASSSGTAPLSAANVLYIGTITAAINGATNALTVTFAPVPLPAAVWLFGSGLLGLAGISRRRARTTAAIAA